MYSKITNKAPVIPFPSNEKTWTAQFNEISQHLKGVSSSRKLSFPIPILTVSQDLQNSFAHKFLNVGISNGPNRPPTLY